MLKKLFLTLSLVVSAFTVFAKDDKTMFIESGSIAFLDDSSKKIDFIIDYSNATVHNDGNDYTLKGYLEHRGPDFVHDWAKKDSIAALEMLRINFNKKNKKGAQALMSGGSSDINAKIILSDIDFGNGAGLFQPFGGAKAGGCIISGKIRFADNNGQEICVLPFNDVKGLGHVSENVRHALAYFALVESISNVIKQEKKKKK